MAAVEVGGLRLPLDEYAWSSPPEQGRPVVLGLRPEDVGLADHDAPYVGTFVPTLVEPTGADLLLRLPFAGTEIAARVDRDADVRIGQPARFAFDLRRVSVFSAHTEQRL